jgi:nucleoside-diphosphate kinase
LTEQTLVIIKPDAIKKQVYGDIIERLTREFVVVKMQTCRLTEKQVRKHYQHVSHLPVFEDMVAFMLTEAVIIMILEGENVIKSVRDMVGSTYNALPGTIRGDYGAESYRTLVHASDSQLSAAEEIKRFFGLGIA